MIVKAAENAGAQEAYGVPGAPVTPLMNAFEDVEFSINEKVAVECTIGASRSGRRSLCVMKHVGVNVAADSLISAVSEPIGAGFVVFVGDDVGARSSLNEQDSRCYGRLMEIPVFDPDSEYLYDAVLDAFDLSESLSIPCIFRFTTPLLQAESPMGERTLPPSDARPKDMWDVTYWGRHHRHHQDIWPMMRMESEKHTRVEGYGEVGIIASGAANDKARKAIHEYEEPVSLMTIGMTMPLPSASLSRFTHHHEHVLVVEEIEPFIEEGIKNLGCKGRRTGHLPPGETTVHRVLEALHRIEDPIVDHGIDIERRRGVRDVYQVCADCPYRPLFHALKQLEIKVIADQGCSMKLGFPPWNVAEATFSLGSSVGIASTMDGVALTGDYALIHSGFSGLINACEREKNVLVIVLDNGVAALSGGQRIPEVTRYLKSLDCTLHETTTSEDPQSVLEELLHATGVRILVIKGSCPKYGPK